MPVYYSKPPPGWTKTEWRAYSDALEKQTRAAEEEARRNGTYDEKMHYGSHPWGEKGPASQPDD